LVVALVEDGTQGLHFCRLQPFCDDPIDPAEVHELQPLINQGRSLLDYVAELSNSKSILEQRFGKFPKTNEVELFSLWLAGLSPLAEEEKLQLLLSKDTKVRLERSVERLVQYVDRINQRRQITSLISETGSTIFTSAGSVIRNMVSSFMSSNEDEGEDNERNNNSSTTTAANDSTNENTGDANTSVEVTEENYTAAEVVEDTMVESENDEATSLSSH